MKTRVLALSVRSVTAIEMALVDFCECSYDTKFIRTVCLSPAVPVAVRLNAIREAARQHLESANVLAVEYSSGPDAESLLRPVMSMAALREMPRTEPSADEVDSIGPAPRALCVAMAGYNMLSEWRISVQKPTCPLCGKLLEVGEAVEATLDAEGPAKAMVHERCARFHRLHYGSPEARLRQAESYETHVLDSNSEESGD